MSHYYEHEGVSFGPRWMQDELDKHGRYLTDFERGSVIKEPVVKSDEEIKIKGETVVDENSKRYTVIKVGKKYIHLKSLSSLGVIIKCPREQFFNNFKIKRKNR